MSSESSSRLRQFGLYKTIDSKTEEFLKLSRKRQIRRGCACAAVSTAITVTVVVGALLIFEFAFRADLKTGSKASRHSTWFNEHTDTASFDKHAPIKSHGKLLAIILKALDQKRYLEAIVDDKSQPELSTGYPYQKNMFSDTRSRKGTRYKPSPFTQNRGRDSTDKAKKIMDYHRVLTYLNSKSFTKTTEAAARDIFSTPQPRPLKKKYRVDKFRHRNQTSTAATKRVRNNVNAKPNITVIQQSCCPCTNRSNLTEMLGKLYKSIQQLGQRAIKNKPEHAKVKNIDISTTVKINQPKYPLEITTTGIKKTKRTTTTINPKLEKATYEYSNVFNIKSNSADRVKSSTVDQNEITTNRNVYSSNTFKSEQRFKEKLVPLKEKNAWKLDFTDVVYDDTADDDAQSEYTDITSRNNSTNENNTISEITVQYTPYTTPNYVQYDLDDKIDNLVPGFIQIPSSEFMKKEKTSVDTDFVNYLNSFNKLKTLIFNKPQAPDTSKENAREKQWNIEHFTTDEVEYPLKFVADTTEKRPVLEEVEEFYKKHSPKIVLEREQDSFMKDIYVNPKITTEKTLERVANMADEKLPLLPMMQTFLMTKKESGLILNLDETTTMSNKLQTDSVEDLPFNTNFYDDYEDVNSSNITLTSTESPAKVEQEGYKNIDVHATGLKKHMKIPIKEAQQHIQYLSRDKDVSTLRTNTTTSTKVALKQYTNRNETVSSVKAHTIVSANETQQDDKNVVLLIYEYAIADGTDSVQNRYANGNYTHETEDAPVANKLDRSYFGFDQDYYERMPLLVNAMQENQAIEPDLDTGIYRPEKRSRLLRNSTNSDTPTSVRRTSPRPFIFELRSPTPTPFSKTFGSKSWVESYRNAQRLENLQQVIEYLETTIDAKFGNLYELPSSPSTHIAFSGVYVKPTATNKEQKQPMLDLLLKSSNKNETKYNHVSDTLDLLLKSSNKKETKYNHVSDPLFSFKPDNPGDVNLLADAFLRFAPTPTLVKDKPNIPMFRPISNRKRQDNDNKNVVDAQASEIKNIETSTVDKPNSFSVMLNYVPTKTTIDYSSNDGTSSAINKVYFTTTKPVKFQLKRRFNGPVKRVFMPRTLIKPVINRSKTAIRPDISRKSNSNTEATMIVHVNLYPQKTVVKEVDKVSENKQDYTTTKATTTTKVNENRPLTQTPELSKHIKNHQPELSFAQVEDHHVGSSGVIPVEHRTVPPPLSPPPETPSIPFETTVSSTTETYSWPTNPPDVVKFSPEDAKVPDHYHRLREENNYFTTEVIMRRFNTENDKFQGEHERFKHVNANGYPIGLETRNVNSEYTEIQSNYGRFGKKDEYTDEYFKFLDSRRSDSDLDYSTSIPMRTNRRNYKDGPDYQETSEPSTLVVKLKNEVPLETTTNQFHKSEEILEEDSDETTTVQTYVPQINGHYRSVNQNTRINDWFDKDDENEQERKRRLEMKVTGLKSPSYVEIKRNNTNSTNVYDKYDDVFLVSHRLNLM